ncbi:MAG: hypothetical protein ACO3X1_16155, partial [Burkholderiaceae bacterium]
MRSRVVAKGRKAAAAKRGPHKKNRKAQDLEAKSDLDERQAMRRTIRGGRSYFFDDPAIDKILNMVVVLGSEVWTLRERLAAMEAIQVKRRQLKAGEIDQFDFSAEDEARLVAERKEFIDSLFRVLQEQVAESRGGG